jgi:hypothetical protein
MTTAVPWRRPALPRVIAIGGWVTVAALLGGFHAWAETTSP